ncbi:hypothetical protein MUP37_00915 [Candidatus Bathyarchaeota archaeon]|nr:hypothetical protein [Candidatus Bathyarchaeota archaeon]
MIYEVLILYTVEILRSSVNSSPGTGFSAIVVNFGSGLISGSSARI